MSRWRLVILTMAVASIALGSSRLEAACNIIPGTTTSFRSTLAVTDRPYAAPGDYVEIRLIPGCDAASPGFPDRVDAEVVTLAFIPPNNGPTSVVVLAPDCTQVEAQRQRCSAAAGVGVLECVETDPFASPVPMEIVTRNGERRLRFRFPDTDRMVGVGNDDRTYTGPVRIAVTSSADPVPCTLASMGCGAHSGLQACVDQFFENDGTCGQAPHSVFPGFTALPPPNSFQDLCSDPSPPCTGRAAEARFTVDAAGNLLIPMDWRGVLIGQGPIARLLRASTAIEAFPGGGRPVRIPNNNFLRSFAPEGAALPPLFDPQADPTSVNEVTFFGSADAPSTVLRVARRSPTFQQCDGGPNDGRACTAAGDCFGGTCATARCVGGSRNRSGCDSDEDCPGGECGAGLFDFSSRLVSGVGPATVSRFDTGVCQSGERAGQLCSRDDECGASRCVAYRISAKDPVPLEALVETEDILAFVVPEVLGGRDLNADGDIRDDVLTLVERVTGTSRAIGLRASSGRAATRVKQLPFSYPAVTAEGTAIAFLESEPGQSQGDLNGDGDIFDAILRVYRLGGDEATPVTPAAGMAVDAAPMLNHRSLVVENGLVFFRVAESASARYTTEELPIPDGEPDRSDGSFNSLSLSKDGRYLAFAHWAPGLVEPFVFDRRTQELTAITLDTDGQLPFTFSPMLSGDGGSVAFAALVDVPALGDDNRFTDVFVHDRDGGKTERVSIGSDGRQGDGPSGNPLSFEGENGGLAMSADGRVVAFVSAASTFAPNPNHLLNVFVRDRVNETTTLVSRLADSPLAVGIEQYPIGISRDGNVVGFSGFDPINNVDGIFLHDRATGRLEPLLGAVGGVSTPESYLPALSGDGSVVAFLSWDAAVPGDLNGSPDVFVRDRKAGVTQRVSVSSDGNEGYFGADNEAMIPISADGRYVIFISDSSEFVPDDKCELYDAFLHDRLTGFTQRVSAAADGSESNGDTVEAAISADGKVMAFAANASNISSGGEACFTSTQLIKAFVRAPDPSDSSQDLTGDGDLGDTVLRVMDASNGELMTLCPAEQVTIEGDTVVFLRPEDAGPAPGCPGSGDLNGDGDSEDQVLHLWRRGEPVRNLEKAATSFTTSTDAVAALVSEEADGGRDLNGDGDTIDRVLQTLSLAQPSAAWRNVGVAVARADVSGTTVVAAVDESAEGSDLNRDGDRDDSVAHVYDTISNRLTNSGLAAEEFVLGPQYAAVRVNESSQNGSDLNGDGDADDDVMHVISLATRTAINTSQTVTPCRLEACDPRLPYRVLTDTIKFLTFEGDQNEDLNNDGDLRDLVVQSINARTATKRLARAGAGSRPAMRRTKPGARGVVAGEVTTIGALSLGICSGDGSACTDDADCFRGVCFLPPGRCVFDTFEFCDPREREECEFGLFCGATEDPEVGSCREARGSCSTDDDCAFPETCETGGPSYQRLIDPLAAPAGEVFLGSGRCIEQVVAGCGEPCDRDDACGGILSCAPGAAGEGGQCVCPSGYACNQGQYCEREHRTCTTSRDCPARMLCRADILVAAARNSDGDELADPFDNCPEVANAEQSDGDGNGVGDACDPAPIPTPTMTPPVCPGDCDADGQVMVDELLQGVAIALGEMALEQCNSFDRDADATVTVDEVIAAVRTALEGCAG